MSNNDLIDTKTSVSAHPEEPATKHDVTEGGAIGAVGGAVVGMLAGGPIGAVIGAIAGGAASAAAVNAVDKRDHDYDGTVSDKDTIASTTPVNTYVAEPTVDRYAEGTYVNEPVTDRYATSTAVATPAVDRYDTTQLTGDKAVIPVIEEELIVGKREVQGGGARVHTNIVETPVEETVNLHEEHVTIDRVPVDRAATAADTAFKDQVFEVTETNEVPVIAKNARVVEEVVIGKTATDRTETVHDTVRRTDVVVDDLTTDPLAKREVSTTY